MKPLNVLVLFDYPQEPPKDRDYAAHLDKADWELEAAILQALKKLGHTAKPFAIFNRITPLVAELRRRRPDVVLNLAETFDYQRHFEAHLVGLLELMDIPYTGCPMEALTVCRNKSFAKRVLSPLRIKAPKALVFTRGRPLRSLKRLRFPAFVKPLGLEGSDGISQASFVNDEAKCLERVRFLHESLKTDAYVEEYIDGRELYAGVLGNERLKVLPLREMLFNKYPEDRPRIATFKAKWDPAFREKWGIRNVDAQGIDPKITAHIGRLARGVYRALGLKGCGRLDLRLTPQGEVYLIEVNPNPNLAPDDEIAMAAKKEGWSYVELIEYLLQLAMQRARKR